MIGLLHFYVLLNAEFKGTLSLFNVGSNNLLSLLKVLFTLGTAQLFTVQYSQVNKNQIYSVSWYVINKQCF